MRGGTRTEEITPDAEVDVAPIGLLSVTLGKVRKRYTGKVANGFKPLEWMGDSRQRVRFFAKDARNEVGHELDNVQHGRDPRDWKPMPDIGPGVREIRVHAGGEHRVLYVAKFQRAVYVLHAFVKKRRRTSQAAIELARSRYQEVLKMENLQR